MTITMTRATHRCHTCGLATPTIRYVCKHGRALWEGSDVVGELAYRPHCADTACQDSACVSPWRAHVYGVGVSRHHTALDAACDTGTSVHLA